MYSPWGNDLYIDRVLTAFTVPFPTFRSISPHPCLEFLSISTKPLSPLPVIHYFAFEVTYNLVFTYKENHAKLTFCV